MFGRHVYRTLLAWTTQHVQSSPVVLFTCQTPAPAVDGRRRPVRDHVTVNGGVWAEVAATLSKRRTTLATFRLRLVVGLLL